MKGDDWQAETDAPTGYQHKLGAGDGLGGDHKNFAQVRSDPIHGSMGNTVDSK